MDADSLVHTTRTSRAVAVLEGKRIIMSQKDNLISRQAAIDALGERPVVWDEWTDEYSLGQRNQYDADLLAIETVPAIDPVKHGKWISVPNKKNRICSICEGDEPYKFSDENVNVFAYCPYCGTRMDGE